MRPRTCGSHASNSAREPKRGSITTSASMGPAVPGLHASIIPLRVRRRGATRSMCVWPRSHPVQVPYSCFSASMPHWA